MIILFYAFQDGYDYEEFVWESSIDCEEDLCSFREKADDIVNPQINQITLTEQQQHRLSTLDPLGHSDQYGCDIYMAALSLLCVT